MKFFKALAVLAALSPSLALAQFSREHPDGIPMPPIEEATKDRVGVGQGGMVAIGQAHAQVDPSTQRVAIIQAPAVGQPAKGGGVIQLSAFGWLEPYADSIVQVLITLGAALLGKSKYSQWLDQSSRDALETFLKNRASSLLADGAVKLQGKSVRVDNGLLYRAANEASTAIPGALKRFNLSPEVVAQKIIDAIPQTAAGAAIVAAAHVDADPHAEPVTDRTPSAPPAKGDGLIAFVPPTSGALA